jgi:hypothetical protein
MFKMTAFISGHLDISQEDFETHYIRIIDNAIIKGCKFIVGDARGVDNLATNYLINKAQTPNITVYHIGTKPRNFFEGCNYKGGYKTDIERDEAMTNASDFDIAWVRPEEEAKKLYGNKYKPGRISGTQQNINRRKKC